MAYGDLNTILNRANEHPVIMGIINITPDSFYDGGRFFQIEKAIDHALTLAGEGADILDIGGESSRPGSEPVSEEEEVERVLPVIEAVTSQVSIPISVDTCKANIARQALESGALVVNDISALRFDPDMAETIQKADAYVVLMHMLGSPRTMQNKPRYKNVVEDIYLFLESRISYAQAHCIAKEHIIVDPGIGFGKTFEHNLEILRHIDRFNELGCPVLVGASRKSMIGTLTGAAVENRIWGTAAIIVQCVLKGVAIHRVHDVAEMRQVADMAAALRG